MAWRQLMLLYLEDGNLHKAQYCSDELLLIDAHHALTFRDRGMIALSETAFVNEAQNYLARCAQMWPSDILSLYGIMITAAELKKKQNQKQDQLHQQAQKRLLDELQRSNKVNENKTIAAFRKIIV